MKIRKRRLRSSSPIRSLVQNVRLSMDEFIHPLFVAEGKNIKEEISSMPGHYRLSPDKLAREVHELAELGIHNLLLFGIPLHKDETGSSAYDPDGIVQQALGVVKRENPGCLAVTDVCMCEYTSHGHCGIIRDGEVHNDETLEYLARIALSHAEAGADVVAPSDMMDGRVGAIRETLETNGFVNTAILAYSVKYSSGYYGPFRDAAGSAPGFGDRKGYQMDFRRSDEALAEALCDIEEGADMIMVKPALAYLDVVKELSGKVHVPLAVYNVSGEYAMVKAAARQGWIDEKRVVLENMYAMKRAGAGIIITYHTKDISRWI